MSLASWEKEFYKTPANKVSKRFALQHSLRKWIGLLRKNRRKHKVHLESGRIYDKNDRYNFLSIDDDSCALCQHFLDTSRKCPKCPLVRAGFTSCVNVDNNSIYGLFVQKKRVMPMVKALEKALKIQSGNNAN